MLCLSWQILPLLSILSTHTFCCCSVPRPVRTFLPLFPFFPVQSSLLLFLNILLLVDLKSLSPPEIDHLHGSRQKDPFSRGFPTELGTSFLSLFSFNISAAPPPRVPFARRHFGEPDLCDFANSFSSTRGIVSPPLVSEQVFPTDVSPLSILLALLRVRPKNTRGTQNFGRIFPLFFSLEKPQPRAVYLVFAERKPPRI